VANPWQRNAPSAFLAGLRAGVYPRQRSSRIKVQGEVLTSAAERLLDPAWKMAEWAGELARAAAKAGPPVREGPSA